MEDLLGMQTYHSPSSRSLSLCLETIAHTCRCVRRHMQRWCIKTIKTIKVERYNAPVLVCLGKYKRLFSTEIEWKWAWPFTCKWVGGGGYSNQGSWSWGWQKRQRGIRDRWAAEGEREYSRDWPLKIRDQEGIREPVPWYTPPHSYWNAGYIWWRIHLACRHAIHMCWYRNQGAGGPQGGGGKILLNTRIILVIFLNNWIKLLYITE
jgi:hypothetical protein